jgi:hypothetical protein
MPAEPVVEALLQVWAILEELQIPSAVMGGLSLAAWNRVRSTHDVDVLIGLAGVRPQVLLSRLYMAGFRAKGRQAIIRLEDAEFIQLVYDPPGAIHPIQVDLLIADTEFQRQSLGRRISVDERDFGRQMAVLSCEDLIVMKLKAGRMIDLVDAAALLHENRGTIDMDYLTRWVAELGVQRRFDEASKEADRLDSLPQ